MARSTPHWLVLGGLAVFFINMALAWVIAFRANDAITRPFMLEDPAHPTAAVTALARAHAAGVNETGVLHRVIEADLYHGVVASKQTLQMVGMALCFGLISIGFALYVMGVRGGFSFSAAGGPGPGSPQTSLAASAPGLLCFVLAAVVAIVALTRNLDVKLGNYVLAAPQAEETDKDPASLTEQALRGGTETEIPGYDDLRKAYAENESRGQTKPVETGK